MRHVAALDGLRGVAVAAVLAYHLWPDRVPGGFLGVSLFFTLSGFLITNLLLNEWQATERVALPHFWSRRFRRLMPAALAGLAVAVLLSWRFADSGQLAALRGDVVACLAYVANWRFIVEGTVYGAGFHEPSPVLHYWSLAIEEQFYVLVALVAVVLARYARSRRTWITVFGVAALGSMWATIWFGRDLTPSTMNRIYLGSDTRAFELLAGVLLALLIGFDVPARLRAQRWRHVAAIAVGGAVVASFFLVDLSQSGLYRGGLWLFALGSVALVVGALDSGPLAKGLSWRPLAALGLISYGVYVYHWPVFIFLTKDSLGIDGIPLLAVRLGFTFSLALLSYRWLEKPVRRRSVPFRPTMVALAVGVTVVALVLGTTSLGDAASTRGVISTTPELQLSLSPLATAPPSTTASTQPLAPLKRVLFVGDSLVHQSFPTLQDRLAGAGIETKAIGGEGQHLLTDDGAWARELSAELQSFDPDVVVLEACCGWGTPWHEEHYAGPDGRPLQPDSPASWDVWAKRAEELTTIAQQGGRLVLWIFSPPAQTNGYYGPIEGRIGLANAIYEKLLGCHPGVGAIDWRVVAAPDGSFTWTLPDAQGNQVKVRHDDGLHFTPEGEAVLADMTRDVVKAQWQAEGGRHPAPAATCSF